MPQEKLPILKQALLARVNWKRSVDNPELDASIIKDLEWNRLGLHPRKMVEVVKYCGLICCGAAPRKVYRKLGQERTNSVSQNHKWS